MKIDFNMQQRSTAAFGKSFRKGFTLIEIMAATAIMVLITVFIAALSSQVMSMWSRSINTLGTNYEARMALDKLAQDIESSVLRRDDKNWFVIREDSELGQPQLMFYAAIPDRPVNSTGTDDGSDLSDGPDRTGDVCAISYRIAYKSLFGGSSSADNPKERLGLYRAIVDARTTFNEALAEDSPEVYWNDNDDFSQSIGNLLSLDVAVMQIDAVYGAAEEAATRVAVTNLVIGEEITINGTVVDNIRYLDIRLGVIGEEGARAFHHDSSLRGATSVYSEDRIEDAIDRYGQWYTRRVTLRSTPI